MRVWPGDAVPAWARPGTARASTSRSSPSTRPASSCACSTRPEDAARRHRDRADRAHRPRSGTATCPTCGRASSTATASHGPYEPEQGHRFNPAKLLLDPYAKAISGKIALGRRALRLHDRRTPTATCSFDDRDSAGAMPKCVVRRPGLHLGRRPAAATCRGTDGDLRGHVRGLTMLPPGHPRGAARHLPRHGLRPDPRPPARRSA